MPIRSVALLMCCVSLAACHQSGVQSRYSDDSSECRAYAEDKQARIGADGGNVAVRNAELVALFSNCMSRNGWQVATPRREGQNAGSTQPGVSLLLGTPTGAAAAGAAAASANAQRNVGQAPQPPAAPVQFTSQPQQVQQPVPQQFQRAPAPQQQTFQPPAPVQAAPQQFQRAPAPPQQGTLQPAPRSYYYGNTGRQIPAENQF